MANVSYKNSMKTKDYIRQSMDYLANEVKEHGKPSDRDLGIRFEICGTENVGVLIYTHIGGDPKDQFTLLIKVQSPAKGLEGFQFDFKGTNEEFYDYASKPLYDCESFYTRVMRMSDKLDDHDD